MNEDELMLTNLMECSRTDLYAERKTLTAAQCQHYEQMQSRRKNGEPVQYILGETNFFGLDLTVNRNVLIPRPETEILVELVIDRIQKFFQDKDVHVLDVGAGSGNIAVTLAKSVKNSRITAIDISPEAMEVAKINAQRHDVMGQIQFCCVDFASFLMDQNKRKATYDIIISNPPYIKTSQMDFLPEDVQWEPRVALDGGSDGLRIVRQIIAGAHALLSRNGYLFMEIGDGQASDVQKIFSEYPVYRNIQIFKDYTKTDRVVEASI